MNDKSAYLKGASAKTITDAVTQVGMVAFLCGGLTDRDIASCAATAIRELDKERIDLITFFISNISFDGMINEIVFEVLDNNPAYRYVYLQKRIKHRKLPGIETADKLIVGPLMDREKAALILPMLNEVFGDKREKEVDGGTRDQKSL